MMCLAECSSKLVDIIPITRSRANDISSSSQCIVLRMATTPVYHSQIPEHPESAISSVSHISTQNICNPRFAEHAQAEIGFAMIWIIVTVSAHIIIVVVVDFIVMCITAVKFVIVVTTHINVHSANQ